MKSIGQRYKHQSHAGMLSASLAIIIITSLLASAQARGEARNIVLILTDDQRYDALGFIGHPFLQTPNLDRMARGGVHFKNAFVTTSLCSPSRASILTGHYAHQHGVLDNASLFSGVSDTFPEILQKSGYDTAFVGKWHMGNASDDPRAGFNHWVSFRGQGSYSNPTFNTNGRRAQVEGYVTDIITDRAIDWLEKERDRPFMLYVSHKAVHGPFEPAERHRQRYRDIEIQYPESMAPTEANYRGKPKWIYAQRESYHGVDWMYNVGPIYDRFIPHYFETLLAVDDGVGRLMDTLEKMNLLESTLIIFTSDNGFLHGEHGLIDKRAGYEESIRIPMILYCPDAFGPRTVEELALNIDLAPTILEAAALPLPEAFGGRSLLALAQGERVDWRKDFLYEYFWERPLPQTPTVLGIRTERYKYLHYHGIWDTDELYDIIADPKEMHNLIDQPGFTDLVKDLRSRLYRMMQETGGRISPTWQASPSN